MLSHHEALTQIKAAKLVAILRHVPADKLDGVVEALIAGGVRVLEFTKRSAIRPKNTAIACLSAVERR